MTLPDQRSTRPETAGLVIHGAARYDLLVWLFTFGGEWRFRERMLRLVQLRPGETAADIGCGTGTLAILAKRQVGAGGTVYGIDPSPEMIARARQKAANARADLVFKQGAVQALPLGDAQVDVVLSTLMLHHVPKKARPDIAREIKRVLKPGGRFLAVDFAKPSKENRSLVDRFHRHGAVNIDDIIAELETAGFTIVRSGPVGEKNLQFVLAANGMLTEEPVGSAAALDTGRRGHRRLVVLLVGGLGVLALIALHGGAGWSAHTLLTENGVGSLWYVAAAILALLLVVKTGLLGLTHRFGSGFLTKWLGARHEHTHDD